MLGMRARYAISIRIMKPIFASTLFSTILFAASAAFAVPSMKVTVFDADGKVAFKGVTSTSGTFATANLSPGHYVVQFNATSAAVKRSEYMLVISAGKKKVLAEAVSGEKFLGGGVAMRLEVGSGLKIIAVIAR